MDQVAKCIRFGFRRDGHLAVGGRSIVAIEVALRALPIDDPKGAATISDSKAVDRLDKIFGRDTGALP